MLSTSMITSVYVEALTVALGIDVEGAFGTGVEYPSSPGGRSVNEPNCAITDFKLDTGRQNVRDCTSNEAQFCGRGQKVAICVVNPSRISNALRETALRQVPGIVGCCTRTPLETASSYRPMIHSSLFGGPQSVVQDDSLALQNGNIYLQKGSSDPLLLVDTH